FYHLAQMRKVYHNGEMKKAHRVVVSGILLLSALIYATLWNAPALTWDDGSNIFNNPLFNMNMWWRVWREPYYGLYVPFTSTFWALLYRFEGGETWPFRAFNIVLHLANIALVY